MSAGAATSVLTPATKSFILHWGEMGSRWGVNRTVAQVHALLYLAPEAMPAEDIAELLAVARSNVSTSLKELQNWELVQVEHRMGDRRDFFRTSHDVWELFMIVIQQRIDRELQPTLAVLQRCAREAEKESPRQPLLVQRIQAMSSLLTDLLAWHGKMRGLPRPTLRALIKVGTGITRWLPAKGNAAEKEKTA